MQHALIAFFAADEEGDFDPDALTSALGITPTAKHRKGDLRPDGVRSFHRSMWKYGVPVREELDWELVAAPVLAAFEGREVAVREACRRMNLAGGFSVVTYMQAEKTWGDPDSGRALWGVATPASYLSVKTIEQLARLGLSLNADMYVELTDAMESLD